jgi:nucleoid DNA-binding protein
MERETSGKDAESESLAARPASKMLLLLTPTPVFPLIGSKSPVIGRRALHGFRGITGDALGAVRAGDRDGALPGLPRRKRMAGKRLTKAQVITELSNSTDMDKKSVSRVFESLQDIIRKQLSTRGPGEFVIPGLVKLRVVKKPATKERQGINPFTKEPITIPAKPASKKVRATALKNLKDLVQ